MASRMRWVDCKCGAGFYLFDATEGTCEQCGEAVAYTVPEKKKKSEAKTPAKRRPVNHEKEVMTRRIA